MHNQFVFLTYEFEACYPSIDIDDAIKNLYENEVCLRHENRLGAKLLEMVMKENFVTANGNIYQHLIGTATGSQVASPFANLYLFYNYKKVLSDESIIVKERCIDDGLMIVKTREAAQRIMDGSKNASNLIQTWNISEI